jgi:two-component system CheB/CheR fusion protein
MPLSPTARPLCVLVVDDYQDAADSLALLVRQWGYQALVAYDGPSALDLALSYSPDVVLLEPRLPGMDGFEVARRLRQVPGMDQALLVAVTGYGRKEDVQRCWDAGIDFHFVKPVDPVELELVLAGVGRFIVERHQLAY